jgi:hypothetical protein
MRRIDANRALRGGRAYRQRKRQNNRTGAAQSVSRVHSPIVYDIHLLNT